MSTHSRKYSNVFARNSNASSDWQQRKLANERKQHFWNHNLAPITLVTTAETAMRRIAFFAAYFGCAAGFAPSVIRPLTSQFVHHSARPVFVTFSQQRRPFSLRAVPSANLGQDFGELFDTYLEPDESFFTAKGGENPILAGKTLPRKQVHSTGVWHRAVHIWIYNSYGQVILQKRCVGLRSTRVIVCSRDQN